MEPIESENCVEYPTPWTFCLIGQSFDDLAACAQSVLGDKTFTFDNSRKTSAGKYSSAYVQTLVFSEEERNDIFTRLSTHPAVKYMI